MKKILLIALVSTVGITAQASVLQAPAKNKNVPKSEVAEPKTLPAKAAPAAAPSKAPAVTPKTNTSKPAAPNSNAKPSEKK
jgi:hypothetical protein